MTRGDADRKAEKPETCPGSSRRKRRGTGRGASNVTVKREDSSPEAMHLMEAVVERENMLVALRQGRGEADGARLGGKVCMAVREERTWFLVVGDHEEVRDFELAPGWGQGSADGESWPQSVDKAAIFLCR